jgi:hypothetical protein
VAGSSDFPAYVLATDWSRLFSLSYDLKHLLYLFGYRYSYPPRPPLVTVIHSGRLGHLHLVL